MDFNAIPHNMPKFTLHIYKKAFSTMQSGKFQAKPWVLELYAEQGELDEERKDASPLQVSEFAADGTINNGPELEFYTSNLGEAGNILGGMRLAKSENARGKQGFGGVSARPDVNTIYSIVGLNQGALLPKNQLKMRLHFPDLTAVENYLAQVGLTQDTLTAIGFNPGAAASKDGKSRPIAKGYLANFKNY